MENITLSYDLDYLNEISNNDDDFLLDMIKTFVEITPVTLQEMRVLLDNKLYFELGEIAHKFAPSLSFIGVQKLINDIDKIENYATNEKNIQELPDLFETLEKNCINIISSLKKDFKL